MHKVILAFIPLLVLISCKNNEAENIDSELNETEDTTKVIQIEDTIVDEDVVNSFNWIENVLTYEGKEPDSHISLDVTISGINDTLDLFTIWSFPEKVTEETKQLYGFPEQTVLSISAYYLEDIISIQEKSQTEYDILYSWIESDTVYTNDPIGEISLNNGEINYSIDLPTEENDTGEGSFYKFGETSPW